MSAPFLNDYRCATDTDHQHAAILSDHFIVDVDADHGIRSDFLGSGFDFTEGNFPSLL